METTRVFMFERILDRKLERLSINGRPPAVAGLRAASLRRNSGRR
jgi:hypothetical protein